MTQAMETVIRELRHGLRAVVKSPGFAAVAVLTLALGIGASTSIFSVVEAVLLRPLPYPNPQQIVSVWEQAPDGHGMNVADPNFEDFRQQNDTLAGLAEYATWPASVSGGSEPVRAAIAVVSRDFFKCLGVQPSRGRTFVPDEMRVHGAPAAIVSHGYWQRYLGAAADLSEVRLTIGGTEFPVVGVMPAGFDFPPHAAAWIPREREPQLTSRTAHNWHCVGRLRNGVTVEQARANLSVIARRISERFGRDVDLADAAVVPLAESMVGDVRSALLTLLGAVGLLLLVGCANVAGLLLARMSTRRKELAVRAALGAGRARLTWQFLAESLVLSSMGGIAGVLITTWTIRLLPAILPANLPRQDGIAVNVPVLLFAVTITLAVAVSLGLFAAWRGAGANPQQALTAASRSYTGGAGQRLRGFLVTGEIAITLVILVGAGLLGRSFIRLISTSAGFRTDGLITITFSTPAAEGDAALVRQIQTIDEIVARLRAVPGVNSAGLAEDLPAASGDNLSNGTFLILDGAKPPAGFEEFGDMSKNPSRTGNAYYFRADEGYFRTIGIPLISGRLFGEQDDRTSPHVAVISSALARQRWPNENPIGHVLEFGNMDGDLTPMTIIGVAGDVRALGLDRPPTPIIYVNYRQRGIDKSSLTIVIRSTAPTSQVVSAARDIFHELAPDLPVKFSTFADAMGGWLASRRFLLLLIGVFAAAALALAAVGIYGVVAFSVTRRTQEIGVRMALGARPADVLRLVVGEGAWLAVVGVIIGIAASLAITRVLSTLLFGIRPTDPVTFAGVAVLLTIVALLASVIPALRATRVSPQTALHYE